MPYVWWRTIGNRRQAVNVHHLLFGQTVHGKKYKGLIGNGGSPHSGVERVQRGLYKISEEQRTMVERELKRLGVIHGFVDEKEGLIPW